MATTVTFTTVGSHTWTVPDGVETVTIECWGAQGGDNGGNGNGGQGGYATGDLSVTGGETLNVYVGGMGGNNGGGFNGGANSGSGSWGGGGGGGSDVRQNGDTINDRVIVGGGGGGYNGQTSAGGGGGSSGQDAGDNFNGNGGDGGTQSSGGSGGSGDGNNGNSGSFGSGGSGASGSIQSGGGGGGGWYGGGGGAGSDSASSESASGGGGSGYTGGVTNASMSTAVRTGDGEVAITYTEPPAAPNNVSATVDADDQITVTWDKDTSGASIDNYRIQIDRDGTGFVAPSGGPTTVTDDGSSSYSATYNPSSDSSYDSQVGADSSFEFRVRAENSNDTSGWSYSGTVYTTPIGPYNPGVNRPDGTQVDLSWTGQSDIYDTTQIQYREDTGDGYGAWTDASDGTDGYLAFDASANDYAPIQSMTYATSSLSAFTIVGWVRTADDSFSIAGFDRSEYWRFGIGSGGTSGCITLNVYDSANGAVQDLSASTALNDGTWHHAAVVFDNGSVTFYLDGASDGSASVGGSVGTGSTRYGFLNDDSEATSYDGSRNGLYGTHDLADFRVYHRALTQSEVQAARDGNAVDSTGLQVHYPVGINGPSVINDQSGNGYDADPKSPVMKFSAGTSRSFSTSDYLQIDARYQFRARHITTDYGVSDWAYIDYGNDGNVYFDDGFESGGLANWDTTSLGDADSGVVNNTATPDTGISGSAEGSHHLRLDGADYVTKQLGDLSNESDVIVRVYMAAGSMDTSSEYVPLQWYDGAAWNDLTTLGWEFNKQGWVQVTALVPSSLLSTDNRVRLRGYPSGGGADHAAFDRVVVSDILHEYTTPSEPSGLALDNTVEDEITVSWTDNSTYEEAFDTDYKATSANSYSHHANVAGTQTTITGLADGEAYDIRTRAYVRQDRHGSFEANWTSVFISDTATTRLPAPTSLSVDSINADGAALSWIDNADNEDAYRIYTREVDAATQDGTRQRTGMDFGTDADAYDVTATGYKGVTGTQARTVSFWFKSSTTGISQRQVSWGAANTGEKYDIRVDATNGEVLRVENQGGQAYGTTQITTGNWVFCTVVFPSGGADVQDHRLYVNASQETVSGGAQALDTAAGVDLTIGQSAHHGDPISGQMAEVTLHNRELSATEITDQYNGTISPNGLVGYWPLDMNQSGMTPDVSEFARDGAITGATLTGPPVVDSTGALAAGTTSTTVTGLLNGEQYDAYVHAETDHSTTREI